jgi:very-short-patch-repair endonuclease
MNKYFVSDAEADFFRVLQRVVAGRAHVLAQVSLRQLLWLPGSNQTNPGRSAWQNKIAAKSVDFLLCEGATLRPLLVIELDEPTHARPHRQGRDAEVEQLLHSAGLPFIRVLTSRTYDTRELAAAVEPYLPRR